MNRVSWKVVVDGKIVVAFNNEGIELGHLSYESVGRHYHFCWRQEPDIRMSPGCLEEVRQKQKDLLKMTQAGIWKEEQG